MVFCRKETSIRRYYHVKILSWLKKVLTQACVFYTFLITAVYLLGVSIDSHWIPTINMVLALLVFSAVLAAANSFLFSDRLVFPLRLILHYAVTTLIFYIVFVVWGGYKANGGSVLTVLAVYTFAYILCAVIVVLYRWLTAESRAAKSEYKEVFSDKDTYTSQFGGNRK